MTRESVSTTNPERGRNTTTNRNRNQYKGKHGGGDRKLKRKSYKIYKGETPAMRGMFFNATPNSKKGASSKKNWVL